MAEVLSPSTVIRYTFTAEPTLHILPLCMRQAPHIITIVPAVDRTAAAVRALAPVLVPAPARVAEEPVAAKKTPFGTCRRAGAKVIFASGEFYCIAVVFGYRRVIFATRAWEANIISLRPQSCKATRSNITVACNNITLTRSAYHFQFDMAFVSANAVLVRKSRWTFEARKPKAP